MARQARGPHRGRLRRRRLARRLPARPAPAAPEALPEPADRALAQLRLLRSHPDRLGRRPGRRTSPPWRPTSRSPRSWSQTFFERLAAGDYDVAVGRRTGRDDPRTTMLLSRAFWALYRRWVHRDIPAGGVDIFGCSRQVASELVGSGRVALQPGRAAVLAGLPPRRGALRRCAARPRAAAAGPSGASCATSWTASSRSPTSRSLLLTWSVRSVGCSPCSRAVTVLVGPPDRRHRPGGLHAADAGDAAVHLHRAVRPGHRRAPTCGARTRTARGGPVRSPMTHEVFPGRAGG